MADTLDPVGRQWSARHPDSSSDGLPYALHRRIDFAEAVTCVLTAEGSKCGELRHWLDCWLADYTLAHFNEPWGGGTNPAPPIDIVLVQDRNVDRLAAEIARIRTSLTQSAVLAISEPGWNAGSARLLDAGADDLLWLEMEALEAAMRTRSVLRRRRDRWAPYAWLETAGRSALLGTIATASLSDWEVTLLFTLASAPGQVVGLDQLGKLAGGIGPDRDRRNLQVRISRLRRKLPANFVIESRPDGYLLRQIEPWDSKKGI